MYLLDVDVSVLFLFCVVLTFGHVWSCLPQNDTVALTTGAAGTSKSTSLPNSPLHAVSQSENGAAVKQPIKIDVSQTTRLKGECCDNFKT